MTVITQGRCQMYVEGMDMNCPLCGLLVQSGQTHRCELGAKKLPDHARHAKRSTRKQKIEWLRQHPELWNADRDAIVERMKVAGLLSGSTNSIDVRVAELIAAAKARQ